jgi:fructose-bisphosphate aldolase class I
LFDVSVRRLLVPTDVAPKNGLRIASFSRALTEDLRIGISDAEFDASLGKAIDQIYRASAVEA